MLLLKSSTPVKDFSNSTFATLLTTWIIQFFGALQGNICVQRALSHNFHDLLWEPQAKFSISSSGNMTTIIEIIIDIINLITDSDVRFWKWYDNEMISLCKLIHGNDNDITVTSINYMISLNQWCHNLHWPQGEREWSWAKKDGM